MPKTAGQPLVQSKVVTSVIPPALLVNEAMTASAGCGVNGVNVVSLSNSQRLVT